MASCERVTVCAPQRFPELQLRDEEITDVADTPPSSPSSGYAALSAMGMLDRNLAGAGFLAQEQQLQLLSVSTDAAGLASVGAGAVPYRAGPYCRQLRMRRDAPESPSL